MQKERPSAKEQDLQERIIALEKEIAELKRQIKEQEFPKWGH